MGGHDSHTSWTFKVLDHQARKALDAMVKAFRNLLAVSILLVF